MIRITGMNSGLDTDSIIKELIKAKSEKLNTLKKAKTKLEWKQDAWKTTNSKIYSFYSKQLSNLRFQSSFKKKSTKVSNENVATVVAGDNAVNGSQSLVVTQLAKAGYLTGGKLSEDKSIKSSSKLNEALGANLTGTASIDVKVGNTTKTISVDGETTVASFVSKLNEAGVNASFDSANQRIFVNTSKSGLDNDFEITAANEDGLKALSALGLLTEEDLTGNQEYQALNGYYAADDATILANLNADGKVTSYAADKAKSLQSSLSTLQKSIDSYQKSIAKKQESLAKAQDNEKYQAIAGDTSEEKKNTAAARLEDAQKAITENAEKLEYIALAAKDEAELTEDEKSRLQELESKYDLVTLDKDELLNEQETLKEELTAAKADVAAVKSVTDLEAEIMELQDKTYSAYSEIHDKALALNEYYGSLSGEAVTDQVTAAIEKNQNLIAEAESYAATYETMKGGAVDEYKLADSPSFHIVEQSEQELIERVKTANEALTGASGYTSSTAVRVNGQNAKIILNGAEFESTSNSFTVNGLTITAKQVSGITGYEDVLDEEGNTIKKPVYEEVSVNTEDDISGIYDMIKTFLKEYNAMIKDLDAAYNADSAKGYEPLTDDEKEAMTDSEIEEWEKKVKDALLRQDSDLGNVISAVKSNMLSTFNINGTNYTLSSFGIETLGYFSSEENERGVYHIDGDPDDSTTSGNTDKLRKMIASDPEVVSSFFSQLANKIYDDLTTRMKSTEYSSIYTVYEDKKMKTDISDYKTKINEAQEKLNDLEDKYYKQFSAMETAIGKLNSQQSSLSSMLGG